MTAKPFCDGPFSTLKGTSWIVGKDHHGEPCHVLDQRGWGYLTGKGRSALGLDNATASAMQAETQQWVVDAMNAAWNRRAVQPAQVKVLAMRDAGYDTPTDPRDAVIARLVGALEMTKVWLDYDGRYDMQGVNAAITGAKELIK